MPLRIDHGTAFRDPTQHGGGKLLQHLGPSQRRGGDRTATIFDPDLFSYRLIRRVARSKKRLKLTDRTSLSGLKSMPFETDPLPKITGLADNAMGVELFSGYHTQNRTGAESTFSAPALNLLWSSRRRRGRNLGARYLFGNRIREHFEIGRAHV